MLSVYCNLYVYKLTQRKNRKGKEKKSIVFKLNFEIIDSHGVVRINMQRSYILFPPFLPVVTSLNTIVQYQPGFTVYRVKTQNITILHVALL